MLVLSRKESERIQIGDNITIIIVRIAGDKVRIGIEAPKDIAVLRTELGAATPTTDEPVAGGVGEPVATVRQGDDDRSRRS